MVSSSFVPWSPQLRTSMSSLVPCAAPNDTRFGTPPPSYVGDNYFCEAGHSAPNWSREHHSEPLWDGQECVNSECCTFNTPHWFSVQLPWQANRQKNGSETSFGSFKPAAKVQMCLRGNSPCVTLRPST